MIYQALLCIDGGPLPARVTRYIRNPYRRVWATDEARLDEIDSTTVEELKQFLLKPKQPPVEQAPAPRIA